LLAIKAVALEGCRLKEIREQGSLLQGT